jgi:GNAT superfamily N-acetyltransferase
MAEMDERFAPRRLRLAFGVALFHDALPAVWDLNFVRVDRSDVALEAVLAETERVQAEAGLVHRKVKLPYEPEVPDAWKLTRLLVMVHRGEVPPVGLPVEEVAAEALREKWVQERGEHGDETLQLIEARFVRDAAADVRYFAASADGQLVSECSVFSARGVAEVDSVQTLEPYRGRGLGKAVVARAVAEAYAAGHDLVFLVADEDDWPKELYRTLGFADAGRVYELLRPPGQAAPPEPARTARLDSRA